MAPTVASSAPSRRGGSILIQYFLFVLLGFGIVMLWINSLHEGVNSAAVFESHHFSVESRGSKRQRQTPYKEKKLQEEEKDAHHRVAGLDCTKYGGPSNEIAAEMVYWSDIPSDNAHISPFYSPDKFLTFEPDRGGWNNIRMSMETVLAMAVAMGRTLVLPPEQGMYLLENHEGVKGRQRKAFSFNDFYHLESIATEHGGLNIITMDEFLKQQALAGRLRDQSGTALFPPENRTDWSGQERMADSLSIYLRSVAHLPKEWDPEICMAAFPGSQDPKDLAALEELKKKIKEGAWDKKFMGPEGYKEFIGKPVPVDASPEERMKQNWAERLTVCIYDEELQKAPLVHFGSGGAGGARLLVHFYAFIFYQDWRHDLWLRRFVRDHVRYVDEIQCAAARVVNAVRERARKRNPASIGEFDSFHIRRGDFQYTVTRFEADKIYSLTKDELTNNSTVYVATDERDKSFFQPLADHYDLVFLDDFKHLIEDVNSNFYGMLDQLIASRGRVFEGCWFSTFTGHINRIRGYHSVKDKLPGHEDGALPSSYYYALEDRKLHMHEFYPVKKQFYAREFPTAWRGIDKGIGEITGLESTF